MVDSQQEVAKNSYFKLYKDIKDIHDGFWWQEVEIPQQEVEVSQQEVKPEVLKNGLFLQYKSWNLVWEPLRPEIEVILDRK